MASTEGEMPPVGPADLAKLEDALRSALEELEMAGLQLAAAYVAMAIDALLIGER